MMKRMFCLLLTVLMGVSCIFASAEDAQDNSADALTLAELQAFAARMQTLAMASTPLNDPADAKTEDGYAFEYSFGTIYADSPAMSIDTQLLSIVLTSAEEQGPRDIQVGDELSIVLEANYSENPSLRGSRESAVLYVLDLLPESMRWGEVKRDGQRVQQAAADRLRGGELAHRLRAHPQGRLFQPEQDEPAGLRAVWHLCSLSDT